MTSDLKTYGEEAIANMFIYVRKQKMLNFVEISVTSFFIFEKYFNSR